MPDGHVGANIKIYYSNLEEVNPREHPMERELPELNSLNRNLKMTEFVDTILSKYFT